jgi:uncharacterized membrane protein
MKTNIEFKMLAKEALTNHWGVAIGALILYVLIINVASQLSFVGLIFAGYPLVYGYSRFNIKLTQGTQDINDLFVGFSEYYLDNAITILIRELLVILWSLLLIVPGIIKGLSWAMVPYLQQDEDYHYFQMESLRKSAEMMNGHKKRLFMLYLSFLGWHLLGLLTLGILNLLYVLPYQEQAIAQFYLDLKANDRAIDKDVEYIQPNIEVEEIEKDEWDF